MSPCPHCRALAVVAPHPTLRWVCGAGGGPRVPADVPGVAPQGPTNEAARAMIAARRHQATAFGLRAATILLSLFAVIGVGIGALLWGPAHAAALVVGGVGTLALMFAFLSSKRAKANDRRALAQVDRAWVLVADEILHAVKREVTARELAEWMRTDERHAEALLTELSAHDRARIDVRDDAELRYAPQAGPRIAAEDEGDETRGGARERR